LFVVKKWTLFGFGLLVLMISFSRVAGNEQVLPMVGNFIFVRPELLPVFLIKLNIMN
jgi:hypothetical protein